MPSTPPNRLKRWGAFLGTAAGLCMLMIAGRALAQDGNFGLNEFSNATNLGTDVPFIETIARIINIALGFLGVLAVGIVIYGGFLWMTARGDAQQIDKAKKVLSGGLIGLAIILASFAIASFVINQLRSATSGGPPGTVLCPDGVTPPPCPPPGFGGNYLVVRSSAPRGGNASLCAAVQAGFNELVQASSVNGTTFQIVNTDTGAPFTSGTYQPATDAANFAFVHTATDFEPNANYRVTLMSGGAGISSVSAPVKHLRNDVTWSFRTGTTEDDTAPTVSAVEPPNGATDICRTTPIQIAFSESMLATSFAGNVILRERADPSVTVPLSEPSFGDAYRIATFYAAGQLSPDTEYEVFVRGGATGVSDACGNTLASDYTWNFRTGQTVDCRPVITGISPVRGDYGQSVTLSGASLFLDGEVEFNRLPSDTYSFDNNPNILCWNGDNRGAACSSGQIVARVPVGASTGPAYDQAGETAATGPVRVTVGNQTSNELQFAVTSPVVESVSPNRGGAGQFVTLTGWNFGDAPGRVYFIRGSTTVEALPPTACTNWWNETEVTVMVPSGLTPGAFDVELRTAAAGTNAGNKRSNSQNFLVTTDPAGPGICEVVPASADIAALPTGVVVTGERFSGSGRSLTFGTLPASGINWVSATQVDADTPNTGGVNLLARARWPVCVTVSGRQSNCKTFTVTGTGGPPGNDTPPRVVESRTCTEGVQSPSPWRGSTDACGNARIAARFTLPMDQATLTVGSGQNIYAEQCGNGAALGACTLTLGSGPVQYLVNSQNDVIGFAALPSAPMQDGYWYRGTITTGVRSAFGVAMADTYQWTWRVGSDLCPVQNLRVDPGYATIRALGDTQTFTGDVTAGNCNSLDPSAYAWQWDVSNHPSDTGPQRASLMTWAVNQAVAEALDWTPSGQPARVTGSVLSEAKSDTSDLYISTTFCRETVDCNACGTGVSDCIYGNCEPVITGISPDNGAIGTWVTINGCYFGAQQGTVRYQGLLGLWPDPAICGTDTWSDRQIISEVPSGIPTSNSQVLVTRPDPPGGNAMSPQNFTVNTLSRPALCRVSPSFVYQSQFGTAAVDLAGQNLGNSSAGNSVLFLSADGLSTQSAGTYNQWTASRVTPVVPIMPAAFPLTGVERTRVYVGSTPSNDLNLDLRPGSPGGSTEPIVLTAQEPAPGSNQVCRNPEVIATFDGPAGGKVQSSHFKLYRISGGACLQAQQEQTTLERLWRWLAGLFVRKAEAQSSRCLVSASFRASGSSVSLLPRVALMANAQYLVELTSPNAEAGSGTACSDASAPCNWTFTTGPEICEVASVQVTPPNYTFTSSGDDESFAASARAADGQAIAATYAWTEEDSSDVVQVTSPLNQAAVTVQSNNDNGSAVMRVAATGTLPDSGGAQGSASIDVYLCEMPWELNDTTYDFRLRYCRGDQNNYQLGAGLLGNGSFENDLAGWSSADAWTFTTDAQYVREGRKSAMREFGSGRMEQDVSVEAGKSYMVSGQVYLEGAAGVVVDGTTVWNDGGTREWFTFSQVVAAGSNAMNVEIIIYAGVRAVFDGFSVREITNQLPELTRVSQSRPGTSDNGLLHEYFLKPPSSNDAIGLRIYENPTRMSPRQWYETRADITPGNPQAVKVDGYEAMHDAQTVYVGAVNRDGSNRYANIYILSLSQGAGATLADIFGKLVDDWQFNTENPVLSEDDKLKHQHDLKRLQDLSDISAYLAAYQQRNSQFPSLPSGSFLAGRSVSAWPSWQSRLGNDLGRALPIDPLNTFSNCPADHDPATCWRASDKTFTCPTGSHVYQYRTSGDFTSYTLNANLEVKNVTWAGQPNIAVGSNDACDSYGSGASGPIVDVSPPSSVSLSVTGSPTTDRFTISWSDAVDGGGSGLARYELLRAPDASGSPGAFSVISASIPPSITMTTDSPSAGVFWYGVRAVDAAGNSSREAAPQRGVKDTTAPSAPSCSPGAGTYNSPQQVACTSSDQGSPQTGAVVRYSTTATPPHCGSPALPNPITVSSAITYRLVACDGAGNMSGVSTYAYTITSASRSASLAGSPDASGWISSPSGFTYTATCVPQSGHTLVDCRALVSVNGGTWTAAAPSPHPFTEGACHRFQAMEIDTGGTVNSPVVPASGTGPCYDSAAPVVTAFTPRQNPTTTPPELTWSAGDTPGSGIARVEVWREDASGAWYQASPALSATDTSWIDGTVTAAGTYTYGLHVVDTAGNCITESGGHCGGVGSDSRDGTRASLGPDDVTYEPLPNVATITMQTQDDSGASIGGVDASIDGTMVGLTPTTRDVTPGSHAVSFASSLPCYTYSGTVTPAQPMNYTGNATVTGTLTRDAPGTVGSNPFPPNNATGIAPSVTLQWQVATCATNGYLVFMGTSAGALTQRAATSSTTYSPTGLANGTTYYWRIDTSNHGRITQGQVWSFTTAAATFNVTVEARDDANAVVSGAGFNVDGGARDTTSRTLSLAQGSHTVTYLNDLACYSLVASSSPQTINVTGAMTVIGRYDRSLATAPSAPQSPTNGQTGVPINTTLTWQAGACQTSYDAYFGTSQSAVQNAGTGSPEYRGNFTGNSYTPSTLSYSTTYYWRIDARNARGVTTGAVWNFTTAGAPVTNVTFIAQNDGGTMLSAGVRLDGSGSSAGTTTFTASLTQGSHSAAYDAVACHTFSNVSPGATFTVGTTPLTVIGNYARTAPGEATNPYPPNGATNMALTTALQWTSAACATSYNVYFGTNPSSLTLRSTQAGLSFTPGGLAYSTTYYWRIDPSNNGRVTTGQTWNFTTAAAPTYTVTFLSQDDAGAGLPGAGAYLDGNYIGTTTTGTSAAQGSHTAVFTDNFSCHTMASGSSPQTINVSGNVTVTATFNRDLPAQASGPSPVSGATNVPVNTPFLTWGSGACTSTFEFYFGTTFTAVNSATTGSSEFKGSQSGTSVSLGPLGIQALTTYFWRVDSRNSAGVAKGQVWSFTTAPTPPQIVIDSPAAGSWQDANFVVTIRDIAGSYPIVSCYYAVYNYTGPGTYTQVRGTTSRVCSGSASNVTLIVDTPGTGDCRTSGTNTCRVIAWNVDSQNVQAQASRDFSITFR